MISNQVGFVFINSQFTTLTSVLHHEVLVVLGSRLTVSFNYSLVQSDHWAFMKSLQMGEGTVSSQRNIPKQEIQRGKEIFTFLILFLSDLHHHCTSDNKGLMEVFVQSDQSLCSCSRQAEKRWGKTTQQQQSQISTRSFQGMLENLEGSQGYGWMSEQEAAHVLKLTWLRM